MCICAEKFSDDDKTRSKYMGIILGSEAMGVLIGYTVGAFIYNSGGKSAPFIVITFMILANAGKNTFDRGYASLLHVTVAVAFFVF